MILPRVENGRALLHVCDASGTKVQQLVKLGRPTKWSYVHHLLANLKFYNPKFDWQESNKEFYYMLCKPRSLKKRGRGRFRCFMCFDTELHNKTRQYRVRKKILFQILVVLHGSEGVNYENHIFLKSWFASASVSKTLEKKKKKLVNSLEPAENQTRSTIFESMIYIFLTLQHRSN